METDPPFVPTAVDLRDYVTFSLGDVAGRRVFATDVVAVDLLCLEPDQEVPARTFASADVVYTVLGGRAWVVADDAEVLLEPLQAVMVPAAVPHGLRNLSADPLILQVVASPPDDLPVPPSGRTDEARAQSAQAGARRAGSGLRDRLRRGLGSAPPADPR